MRNRYLAISVIVAILMSASAAAGGAEKLLNDDWWFYKFDAAGTFDISALPNDGWEKATLPHTARVEPRVVNDQWQGDALYRRTITANPDWQGKAVWLRFEGAMMVATVYLDGREVYRHKGGYLPFTVDLSNRLQPGKSHEILVHLDNRDNPLTGPKPLEILDFNMYGGLYREVRLLVRDSLHITDKILEDRVAGGGVFVTFPEVSKKKARVAVKTHIRNSGSRQRSFKVIHHLYFDDQKISGQKSGAISLEPGADVENQASLDVSDPRLWSPWSPNLYRLESLVVSDSEVIDQRSTPLGIRRISFTGNKLSINGETRFLRGVNRHQEYPYIGYALSPQADYRDAKLIKEAGFDYVRLSHYPHSRHFMKAADELGLVVVNAILGWQYYNPDPVFSDHIEQTCRDLVRRDRNHPSVIAWECSLNESAMPEELVSRLHRTVHEEYPGDQSYSAGWMRGYDIYLQARQHRLQHYEEPDQPYIVSEYGDWEYYAQNAGLNQDSWEGLKEEERTSRQALGEGERRLLQQATNIQEAHNDNFNTPAFADGYWVMFDYNRGYADDHEHSGIMSIERVPKFSYYLFRSQRDADEPAIGFEGGPVLKIASYWNEQSATAVRVYSNVQEVELILNGVSLGRQPPDSDRISENLAHPPFTFDVGQFTPGKLEAIGYMNGKEIARDVVRTAGETTGIELALMEQGVAAVPGDLLFLQGRLVDGEGTRVPENGTVVTFSTECPAKNVTLVGPAKVEIEAGVASTLIRFTGAATDCQVVARVEGKPWMATLMLKTNHLEISPSHQGD